MDYLKKYGIMEDEIKEIKDIFNERIIEFMISEEDFITEKCEYLLNKGYFIFPILENNIKVFLEEMKPLKEKIEKLENKKYSRKSIQMILINEQLYNKV